MKKFFLIAAVVLTFVSCNSTKAEFGKKENSRRHSSSISSFEGNWQLTLLMKDGVAQVLAESDLTIAEKGGDDFQLSGFMGANYFNGEASLKSAGQIKVESFGSTKRGASPAIMEFEMLFSQFLAGVDSCSVEKFEYHAFETLVLKNSAMNAYAHFSRNSIFGAIWKLNSINDGNAVASVSSGANMKLEGISASIFTGINRANLGANADEKKCRITFSEGPMTRMAGSEEEMRAESLFLRRLFEAKKYSLSGGILSLYDDGGTLLLEFEKQDSAGKFENLD